MTTSFPRCPREDCTHPGVHWHNLDVELHQVAAVAVQWVAARARRKTTATPDERREEAPHGDSH